MKLLFFVLISIKILKIYLVFFKLIMKRVKNNIYCLQLLGKCKPTLRKAILSNGDEELICSICECILNVLNGNVKLEPDVLKKLSRYKKFFRQIAHENDTFNNKKKILVQNGGAWMPFLIPPLIEVVRNILKI